MFGEQTRESALRVHKGRGIFSVDRGIKLLLRDPSFRVVYVLILREVESV